ncbi:hypothetical protein RRG08_057438 [Elysia crispata]|uniref:Uncharacterized protein n=1 Tax=Elysia crispata TaxID=231223 RepID=A0AAE0Z3U5_9GAST|nr:hypothetical protein RRG08_057438 [Elysia crispata]
MERPAEWKKQEFNIREGCIVFIDYKTVGEEAPGRQCKQQTTQRSDARVNQHPGGVGSDGKRWMSESEPIYQSKTYFVASSLFEEDLHTLGSIMKAAVTLLLGLAVLGMLAAAVTAAGAVCATGEEDASCS